MEEMIEADGGLDPAPPVGSALRPARVRWAPWVAAHQPGDAGGLGPERPDPARGLGRGEPERGRRRLHNGQATDTNLRRRATGPCHTCSQGVEARRPRRREPELGCWAPERTHTREAMGQGTPMSQRTLPNLHDQDAAAVGPRVDAPEIRREPPTPESAIAPVNPPADRSRLGVVLALVGTGLLMQGAADALARAGHESSARPLFFCALSLLFGACAWRLTSAHAARRERVLVSLALGLGLFASYVMHQPLQLDSFDELIHVGTLVQLLDSHALFPAVGGNRPCR